jgi:hypothetical protein
MAHHRNRMGHWVIDRYPFFSLRGFSGQPLCSSQDLNKTKTDLFIHRWNDIYFPMQEYVKLTWEMDTWSCLLYFGE